MNTDIEVWKDIPGYEGYYQVSNLSRLKSIRRYVNHWRGCERVVQERILELTTNSKKVPYKVVTLAKEGGKKKICVHVLIATAFIPNPENKPQVNHKDTNKLNNSIDNLEWVTHRENIVHAINNNLCNLVNADKLITKEKIVAIHRLRKQGYNQFKIADIFNVSQSVISRVLSQEGNYKL